MDDREIRELQERIEAGCAFAARVRAEVGRFVVGQDELVTRMLIGLVANGHLLVEGVPGLAKTLAIKVLAESVGCRFARLQFTPDLLPADLLGTQIYDSREHEFVTRRGPVFANLILADEINRAPAKVQSALLEAMQERQVTLGGESMPLPNPFLVMATQNPIELEGTYPLPEAQVDRFMLKVLLDYPSRPEEELILERMGHPQVETTAAAAASSAEILAARDLVDRVYLDPRAAGYILDLVMASRLALEELSERQKPASLERFRPLIQYGASPRATLSLALAAKAFAFLEGRAYVVPDDIKAIALDVLRHRVTPSYEAEAEGMSSSELVSALLDAVVIP